MSEWPLLSVVIAAHNEERFVRDAVESVLGQTFSDFECIIVDDHSTDDTSREIGALAERDSRIRMVRNDKNLGLTRSLNIAIDLAVGKYIARMDADDICLPQRFEKQLEKFSCDPDLAVCGTSVIEIDGTGRRITQHAGITDAVAMDWYGIFRAAIYHPTAMFPKALFDQGYRYDESLKTAQDYDLWSRMREAGRIGVLSEPLLFYRTHPNNISNARRALQIQDSALILRRNLVARARAWYGSRPLPDLGPIIELMYGPEPLRDRRFIEGIEGLFELEEMYLRSLGRISLKSRRRVQRLTVRWIVQGLARLPKSALVRGRLLSRLATRLPQIVEEGGRYVTHHLWGKVTI